MASLFVVIVMHACLRRNSTVTLVWFSGKCSSHSVLLFLLLPCSWWRIALEMCALLAALLCPIPLPVFLMVLHLFPMLLR